MMKTAASFSSQREAVQAAREFIWGDVPFSKREFVDPKRNPEFGVYVNGYPEMAVSANVNGRLISIHFDHYGRVRSDGIQIHGKVETR